MRDAPRIGVNVERTVRHDRHFKTERTQRRYDEIPPAPEFQASRFVNRKRSRLKTRQCRMLRERRRADEEVLREFFSIVATIAGGTTSQPSRQPVMLKYFEKLFTVTTSSPSDSADTGFAS